VPGPCVEPTIDVLLVVDDPSDERPYVPSLEAAGHTPSIREPDRFEHRLLKRSDPNIDLHFFSYGAPEIGRMLRLRDRLRPDNADRKLYARTKRILAQRVWRHVQDYADAKTDVIEDMIGRIDVGKY